MIDPCLLFRNELPKIIKPARYLGGEIGSTIKIDAEFSICLCFPDLYEIGMANNAMKIIYSKINAIDDISCERVFAVDLDYENLLRTNKIPLYALETGSPVSSFDILAFTIGYELLATNILAVLELSGIPLLKNERKDEHPIIMAGGPAITNPVPFSDIFDAVWIGEAEDAFFTLIKELREQKLSGASRTDLLKIISKESAIWIPGKQAIRHIYSDFSTASYKYAFPIPIVKPIQDHGIVEIMRGCPNGCRFCHAGYYYRPQRIRSFVRILEEVESQVLVAGQNRISLSSLSSGDYPGIVALVKLLNKLWSCKGVSFQLPSLKIESFPLELIEDISGMRKSGLTFAIETPIEQWQMTLNKKVGIEKIKAILSEAGKKGYRLAKFYFMIGLPLPIDDISEEEAIISFIREISKSASGFHLNIAIATFVPKPHTPFQWSAQLPWEVAEKKIFMIKDAFRGNSRVKITYQSPYASWLEGIISRGNKEVGLLVLEAYRLGARFDAWDDKFNKEAWQAALLNHQDIVVSSTQERSDSSQLAWAEISIRVSKKYLIEERDRATKSILTPTCSDLCLKQCGSCSSDSKIEDSNEISQIIGYYDSLEKNIPDPSGITPLASLNIRAAPVTGTRYRILFRYTKIGRAAFFAHQELHSMINSAFERSGAPIAYSQGFNPMPRLEISEPLSLGFESDDEYGLVLLSKKLSISLESLIIQTNLLLHKDMQIIDYYFLECPENKKIPSLSSVHWGSKFLIDLSKSTINPDQFYESIIPYFTQNLSLAEAFVTLNNNSIELILPFTGKKELGLSALFEKASGISIRNAKVIVRRILQMAKLNDSLPTSYFNAYKSL